VTAVVGWLVQKREQGRWIWAKNVEQSCSGLVLGPPCQTAVEGDGGRCWGGLYEATAIAARRVHKHMVGEGVGQKPETKHDGLVSGCIWIINQWRGVQCGHRNPCHSNLGGRDMGVCWFSCRG
jgi:hypothetical protein